MRLRSLLLLFAASVAALAQKPFTLQQVLSAPYASELTAAPVGNLFAWVEDAEGRHNLWVGGPGTPARMLTHDTEDDAQDITHLAWSPDGMAIAYAYGASSGADGRPANPAHLQRPTPVQVVVQPLAEGAKAVVVGEGRSPLFEPLHHHLLFLRGGQIWSVPMGVQCGAEGGGCQPWVDLKSVQQLVYDRGSASSLTLSPDGTTLAFISRRTESNEPAHSLLALFDLRAGVLTLPATGTGNDLSPAWSPDGKQIAWLRAPFRRVPEFALDRVSANPWTVQLMDLGTRAARTVFMPEAHKPGSVLPKMATGEPPLLFARDHKLVFASEADRWVHLYALDLERPAAKPVLLTPGAGDVEDPVMGRKGMLLWSSNIAACEVAGYTTGNDPIGGQRMCDGTAGDHRHLWELEADGPKVLETGFGIEMHPAIAADGSIAALVSDARTPMHAALVSAAEGMTPLHTDALPGSYRAAALVVPEQVLFRSVDGMHLHAQLFVPGQETGPSASLREDNPKGRKGNQRERSARLGKRPAILFFHGGPRRQMLLGYPSGEYYSNAYAMNQYLASRGFIVLSVNYRCGIGYGLEFRQCAHAGADGASEYADVLAAQQYLASRPDVDAKRIGVWGGSYGGYLTALALARNSDLFAAGVDFHGVHDWNLEDNAGDWKIGTFAQQDAIAAKALASSPMGAIDRWRSPVLLIHGDNDPEVAYAQTPVLAEALRARHVAVEELVFPDEVHGFLLHRDWVQAYEAAAAFFERVLKP